MHMQRLLTHVQDLRATISQGIFYQHLTEIPIGWWVHQLAHQSRGFTQALALRYARCSDERFADVFARHAHEELLHPEQLRHWMEEHALLGSSKFCEVPATPETLRLLALCRETAVQNDTAIQIAILNVVSEGVALDFYTRIIPLLKQQGLNDGAYWRVHREVDDYHLRMGLDLLTDADEARCMVAAETAATAYGDMLTSWRDPPLPRVG